ncbi:MAG TPA: hypothetical protein VGN42_12560, partial [Pirellulales bacterium]|nr:hypothetical protein [Pirellulales bacterium]
MNPRSEEFSLLRVRVLAILVSIFMGAGIALANLSSEPVTAELLDAKTPERAYGWPLVWYWRGARFVPGTIEFDWNGVSPDRVLWPVSRYTSSSLIANLAIWLILLAASSVACERLLRRYRPRLYWRPRLTTLLALIVVSAPTLLANLSFDVVTTRSWSDQPQRSLTTASFGWPLTWYWHFVVDSKVRGWDYGAGRLAANLGIWFLMLALVALIWEWWLRRYRPRLHWSLRTMLVMVAVAAGLCAWCAAARNRAQEEDALTALAGDEVFYVERWGPKWLDLLGADPFRRRIVGAFLMSMQTEEDEEILERLARLPDLRFF